MSLATERLTRRTAALQERFDAVTWLTWYLVLLYAIPSKLVLGPLGSAGAPSMVFGLGSLLLWVFFRLSTTQRTPMRTHPVRFALGVFAFTVGLTYAWAMAHPMSSDEISPADVALLALASWSGTLLIAHDGVMSRARLDTLVWRIVVCGGLLGLLGIVQALTGQPLVDRISIPGLTLTEATGSYTRNGFFRPAGTAIHPIEYGVIVTMLLPLALHVGFQHKDRGRVVRWLPAVALAAVVPLSSSRSAYLGAAIGVAIVLFGWTARQRKVVLGLVAAGVVAMFAVTPHLAGSIVGLFAGADEDPSIQSRTGSLDVAGAFIARSPILGRGLGTFLPKYRIFDNEYLGLLVTVGILGTAAFLAIGVTAIVVLLRVRRVSVDDATRDLALSLTASVAVGFVSLSLFDAFAFPMTMGTLFLLLGIAGALRRLRVVEGVPA